MTINDLFVDVSPWVKVGLYYVAAAVGMIAHWLKNHLTQETQMKLHEWFFKEFKYTAYTAASVIGTSIPSISTLNLDTTSALAFVTMGFSLGFASDSTFNSETPLNTPQEPQDPKG